MKKRCFILVLLLTVISIHSVCFGAELFEGALRSINIDPEELKGSVVGIGVLASTQPYEGVDNSVSPVPIIVGRYKNFFVDGTSFGYIVKETEELKLAVVGQPRFMGYESGDSTMLDGMADRDWSFDGGLKLGWLHEYFNLDITGLVDLSNNHQGQELSVMASKEIKEGLFTPRIGFKVLSDDVVDYYYGVLGNEARANRPAYEGDSTVNFVTGFAIGIPLGEEWAAVLDYEYETLGSDISNSPIVDESAVSTVVVGIVYRF